MGRLVGGGWGGWGGGEGGWGATVAHVAVRLGSSQLILSHWIISSIYQPRLQI